MLIRLNLSPNSKARSKARASARRSVVCGVPLARGLLGVLLLAVLCVGNAVYGQAGLRESLERLDTNEDGEIEPDEITPLARPFLEKIAESRRMSLDRPNRIDKLQEASRIYHAIQNGVADDRVAPRYSRQHHAIRSPG